MSSHGTWPDGLTCLLVHGGWHGSWCWAAFAELLSAAGVPVRTVDLPSVGADRARLGDLHDDAAVIREAAIAVHGPVLVLAHSYGGAAATEGLAGVDNVVHIVYLAAFMLDTGDSLLGAAGGADPDWWITSADGQTIMPNDPRQVFFNDCPDDMAAAAVSKLLPQNKVAVTQSPRQAAWHTIGSTYVICERDQALPVDAQEAMSARAGKVYRLASDHSPFLSHPHDLLALLREVASTS